MSLSNSPTETASATAHGRRLWFALPLVALWLAGTVYAFWWFEFRHLRPFELEATERAESFSGEGLATALAGLLPEGERTTATLFHFWDPACPCSRFNELHVRELRERYAAEGIRFAVIPRPGRFDSGEEARRAAAEQFGEVELVELSEARFRELPVPSAPALAILDAADDEPPALAYFGPYSVGAVCSSSTGTFAESTLDELLAGKRPRQLNTVAFGCFCELNGRRT